MGIKGLFKVPIRRNFLTQILKWVLFATIFLSGLSVGLALLNQYTVFKISMGAIASPICVLAAIIVVSSMISLIHFKTQLDLNAKLTSSTVLTSTQAFNNTESRKQHPVETEALILPKSTLMMGQDAPRVLSSQKQKQTGVTTSFEKVKPRVTTSTNNSSGVIRKSNSKNPPARDLLETDEDPSTDKDIIIPAVSRNLSPDFLAALRPTESPNSVMDFLTTGFQYMQDNRESSCDSDPSDKKTRSSILSPQELRKARRPRCKSMSSENPEDTSRLTTQRKQLPQMKKPDLVSFHQKKPSGRSDRDLNPCPPKTLKTPHTKQLNASN